MWSNVATICFWLISYYAHHSPIWKMFRWVDVLFNVRALPLQALSLLVLPLPYTLPMLLAIQLAVPCAIAEGKSVLSCPVLLHEISVFCSILHRSLMRSYCIEAWVFSLNGKVLRCDPLTAACVSDHFHMLLMYDRSLWHGCHSEISAVDDWLWSCLCLAFCIYHRGDQDCGCGTQPHLGLPSSQVPAWWLLLGIYYCVYRGDLKWWPWRRDVTT
jgi:hypothetical protein